MNVPGLSLLKNTKICEGTKMQFKTEVLNSLNHPIMRAPNTTPTSSSFGSTVGANQVNFARRIRLSVRFIF